MIDEMNYQLSAARPAPAPLLQRVTRLENALDRLEKMESEIGARLGRLESLVGTDER
jgi:hypothetical protein